VKQVAKKNRSRLAIHVLEGADHGFHVLKRSGRTDESVLEEIATASGEFCGKYAR
jgi:hypothetical protein